MKLTAPLILLGLTILLPLRAQTPSPAPDKAPAPTAKGSNRAPGALGKTKEGKPAAKAEPSKAAATAPGVPAPPSPLPPESAPGEAPPALRLEAYLGELKEKLQLSDDESKAIQSFYLQDGTMLHNILNDDALSPQRQLLESAKIRNERNGKINALLARPVRQAQFSAIEANYRPALLELAAAGGLMPAGPIPTLPAPSQALPGTNDLIGGNAKGIHR